MHPKATGVTPMTTFQTLMTSSHLGLLKRQGTHLVGQELWLRAEEVYSLQMFCKTMAGLYESFSKMFVLCN